MADRALALGRRAQVLGAAVVGLQAGEAQAVRDDLVRQRGRGRRCDAAAAMAHVDLDEYVDRAAGRFQRGGETIDAQPRVDRDGEPGASGQRRQLGELAGIDDFVADVEIGHAGFGQRLRLGELLHAHAHRADGDLPLGDLGALVRLGVRAQAHAVLARIGGHARDVALQRVEVDHQRRRGDGGDRIAHARGGGEAHEALPGGARRASASLNSSCTAPSRCPVSAQPTRLRPCGV